MVSILEPLRPVRRTHSSAKQHSKVHVRGQARILLCDVGRFFENAPLGRQYRVHTKGIDQLSFRNYVNYILRNTTGNQIPLLMFQEANLLGRAEQ